MVSEHDSVDEHISRWSEHWRDDDGFDAGVEGAFTRMSAVLRRRDRETARMFHDAELTLEDYNTLHVLLVQPYPGEATPAGLAEAAHVTRAAMTSRLDRLVASGLVTREVDPIDRRRVIVRPSASGRAAWESNVHEGMRIEQHLLAPLSADQLRELNALLRRVVATIEQADG